MGDGRIRLPHRCRLRNRRTHLHHRRDPRSIPHHERRSYRSRIQRNCRYQPERLRRSTDLHCRLAAEQAAGPVVDMGPVGSTEGGLVWAAERANAVRSRRFQSSFQLDCRQPSTLGPEPMGLVGTPRIGALRRGAQQIVGGETEVQQRIVLAELLADAGWASAEVRMSLVPSHCFRARYIEGGIGRELPRERWISPGREQAHETKLSSPQSSLLLTSILDVASMTLSSSCRCFQASITRHGTTRPEKCISRMPTSTPKRLGKYGRGESFVQFRRCGNYNRYNWPSVGCPSGKLWLSVQLSLVGRACLFVAMRCLPVQFCAWFALFIH